MKNSFPFSYIKSLNESQEISNDREKHLKKMVLNIESLQDKLLTRISSCIRAAGADSSMVVVPKDDYEKAIKNPSVGGAGTLNGKDYFYFTNVPIELRPKIFETYKMIADLQRRKNVLRVKLSNEAVPISTTDPL